MYVCLGGIHTLRGIDGVQHVVENVQREIHGGNYMAGTTQREKRTAQHTQIHCGGSGESNARNPQTDHRSYCTVDSMQIAYSRVVCKRIFAFCKSQRKAF